MVKFLFLPTDLLGPTDTKKLGNSVLWGSQLWVLKQTHNANATDKQRVYARVDGEIPCSNGVVRRCVEQDRITAGNMVTYFGARTSTGQNQNNLIGGGLIWYAGPVFVQGLMSLNRD